MNIIFLLCGKRTNSFSKLFSTSSDSILDLTRHRRESVKFYIQILLSDIYLVFVSRKKCKNICIVC